MVRAPITSPANTQLASKLQPSYMLTGCKSGEPMSRIVDPALAERRRHQILDAALTCFRRRGFHQATMHEICAEAGMSPGALYRYFAAKDDIIAAIVEAWASEDIDAIERSRGTGPFLERLDQFVAELFERFERRDGLLMADILAEATRNQRISHALTLADRNRIERCIAAIHRAQAQGELDGCIDAEDAAHVLFAAIEGLELRMATLHDSDRDTARRRFRELAERYLLART